MFDLSSLFVVSGALLSTFALPSICTPSSSTTSFVVAAPSNNNALFRDSTLLTDRLSRIVLEINSVLDSEDQNEEEEEQEELENEQEIQQIASEDLLEDLTEGDQIIGTINSAEGAGGWPWTWVKKAPQVADLAAAKAKAEKDEALKKAKAEKDEASKKANAEQYEASRMAVHSGLKRAAKGARDVLLFPAYKGHQWHGQLQKWNSPEARQDRRIARSAKRLDRKKQSISKSVSDLNKEESKHAELVISRSSSGRSDRQGSEAGDDRQVVVTEVHEG